jgi:hypothetical protein
LVIAVRFPERRPSVIDNPRRLVSRTIRPYLM